MYMVITALPNCQFLSLCQIFMFSSVAYVSKKNVSSPWVSPVYTPHISGISTKVDYINIFPLESPKDDICN